MPVNELKNMFQISPTLEWDKFNVLMTLNGKTERIKQMSISEVLIDCSIKSRLIFRFILFVKENYLEKNTKNCLPNDD
jgi:hypothetical protein